jgi:uncharacterized protein
MRSPDSEVPSPAGNPHFISAENTVSISPRIPSLDVLRGIAILGALFISIWIFGGFSTNQQNGLLLTSKGLNYRLFGTVDILLNGKMRALIAIVFGAGMLLFFAKENQKNQLLSGDLFMRRQLWLLFFGLVNALVFLWSGDMLFHLGMMGILLFPFVRMSKRGLLIAVILVTLIYSGKNYWNYADDRKAHKKYVAVLAVEKKISKDSADRASKDSIFKKQGKDTLSNTSKADTLLSKKDTLTKEQKDDKAAWEGIVNNMKYDRKKDDGERKEMRSVSYGKLWNHLLGTTQQKEAQWTYQTGIWDFSSMILLGMVLFKIGFFNSGFSRRKYLLIAVAGIALGLLSGWFRLHYQQIALKDYAKFISSHAVPYHIFFPFERGFMAVGYAGLVLAIIGTSPLKGLWRSLASTGQMALTNYLFQSIICSWFFTGFGMGYYGRLNQWQLYFFVLEVCISQIVFSVLWLRHFQYGPAEWLWRCLIYKKWLPNRINHSTTAGPAASVVS